MLTGPLLSGFGVLDGLPDPPAVGVDIRLRSLAASDCGRPEGIASVVCSCVGLTIASRSGDRGSRVADTSTTMASRDRGESRSLAVRLGTAVRTHHRGNQIGFERNKERNTNVFTQPWQQQIHAQVPSAATACDKAASLSRKRELLDHYAQFKEHSHLNN